MRSMKGASGRTVKVHGAPLDRAAMVLLVTVALLGGGACASSRGGGSTTAAVGAAVASTAAGLSGGLLTQLALFTLSEILQMRRSLESAETVAAARRLEWQQTSRRARSAPGSADSGRLDAAVASAALASEDADAALADVQARLARELELTGLPRRDLSAAIRARLDALEELARAREQR